jgi:sugar lactone lactonase YvrE
VTQTASTIADKYNGKKLDSPNDDVVASDGSIWFTDPAYGIGGNYEGMKAEQEQEKHNVYQVDPKSGAIKVMRRNSDLQTEHQEVQLGKNEASDGKPEG